MEQCYGLFRRDPKTGLLEGYCIDVFMANHAHLMTSEVASTTRWKFITQDSGHEYVIIKLTATGKRNPFVMIPDTMHGCLVELQQKERVKIE